MAEERCTYDHGTIIVCGRTRKQHVEWEQSAPKSIRHAFVPPVESPKAERCGTCDGFGTVYYGEDEGICPTCGGIPTRYPTGKESLRVSVVKKSLTPPSPSPDTQREERSVLHDLADACSQMLHLDRHTSKDAVVLPAGRESEGADRGSLRPPNRHSRRKRGGVTAGMCRCLP